MNLIFSDRFCFVHVPFVNMVKFQSLVQFPVDSLSNPVMSILGFHLCQFTAFAYYVIN